MIDLMAGAAQEYPTRPITIVMPFGASAEQAIRPIAERMSAKLGQQVIIESKMGAGGTIGTAHAVAASPDGYTLVVGGAGPLMILPEYRKLPYDVERDLIPVAWIAEVVSGVAVHPSLGVKNVAEFVEYAKRNPGTVNFPSAGYGTTSHLRGELFAHQLGVNLVHVPYKTNGDAMPDLLAGRVQLMFESIVFPHAKAGKLQLIAVLGDERVPDFPEVATLAEQGFRNFDIPLWYALYAPAKTPRPILETLNRAVAEVVGDPAFAKQMAANNLKIRAMNLPEVSARMDAQRKMYRTMLKDLNIKLN